MTCGSCFNGELNGLQISHLSDEDDIRVLPQGRPQSTRKGAGMASYFPMVNDTSLAHVHNLNRILNGDDMILAALISIIDDGCQGRGFTATSWTSNQYKPFLEHGQLCDNPRQAQLICRQHWVRDQ